MIGKQMKRYAFVKSMLENIRVLFWTEKSYFKTYNKLYEVETANL